MRGAHVKLLLSLFHLSLILPLHAVNLGTSNGQFSELLQHTPQEWRHAATPLHLTSHSIHVSAMRRKQEQNRHFSSTGKYPQPVPQWHLMHSRVHTHSHTRCEYSVVSDCLQILHTSQVLHVLTYTHTYTHAHTRTHTHTHTHHTHTHTQVIPHLIPSGCDASSVQRAGSVCKIVIGLGSVHYE